jgi:hypothetical protein
MMAGAAVICLVPLLAAAEGLAVLWAEDTGHVPAVVPAFGGDGLWLGHAWVAGQRDADLAALAARIRSSGIRDLFVHVGPLSDDGSLSPSLRPRARWLLAGLHRLSPAVRVQAWLGDLVSPGHLDLANPLTRARVLRSARQVLTDGFNGINYDLEPVTSGDRGFLDLLAATHVLTRSMHRILSIAADQIEPAPYLHTPEQWIFRSPHWWSSAYFHAVATHVDEVAMMAYGTAVPFGPSYSGYVRVETQLALAATPQSVTVLIGLPAYHSYGPGHPSAETVAAAIRGVRLALGLNPVQRPVGVALYADFSARPIDWAAYFSDWADLRRGHPVFSLEPAGRYQGFG